MDEVNFCKPDELKLTYTVSPHSLDLKRKWRAIFPQPQLVWLSNIVATLILATELDISASGKPIGWIRLCTQSIYSATKSTSYLE